jgi:hypothetical protein
MGRERRIGVTIDANQLGGYALMHFGFVARFGQHNQAGVGMHINKAGADNSFLCLNHTCGLHPGKVTPQDADSLSFHTHGPIEPWVSRAINNQSISNEKI